MAFYGRPRKRNAGRQKPPVERSGQGSEVVAGSYETVVQDVPYFVSVDLPVRRPGNPLPQTLRSVVPDVVRALVREGVIVNVFSLSSVRTAISSSMWEGLGST